MKKLVLITTIALVLVSVVVLVRSQQLTGDAPSTQPTTPVTAQNSTSFPLVLPDGFKIETYAKNLTGARSLEFDPSGTLLVSLPKQGRVAAIINGQPQTVFFGLNRSHGLAFSGDTLFVAETDKIVRYDYNTSTHKASNPQKILDLPGGGNHWTREILVKDNQLFVSIGSTCNVCLEKDTRRATVYVSDLNGKNFRVYATGLRNAPFITTHPQTRDLWATEMGRDYLGDDLPPDEINILYADQNYGWPYCYGKAVIDTTVKFPSPEVRRGEGVRLSVCGTPSKIDLPAHSAPLGLAFIPDSWPKEYRGQLLVAFHGSWNRSSPTGYKVALVNPESGEIVDFISGWLISAKQQHGRPVDLTFDKAGNLYISDDHAGVIYKVSLLSSK